MIKLVAIGVGLLALAAKGKKEEAPADPNAVVAKSHGGKVFVTEEALPSGEGAHLQKWLAARPPAPEIGRKTKEGPWSVSFVAVFKKPAAKGPMTVQFFEKGDAKNIVDVASLQNDVASLVYQSSYDLEPDKGFNKGRGYVMKVGQIIKGKFQPYGSGELTLK